jgi:23S rRNA (uracil1939-C5)-methyltransferase
MQRESIVVEIERILPGGFGLAHAEGLTLFVPLAAPGDIVRIQVNRVRGKVGFATINEVVKPSPLRVEPPCPYFGRCGGCDFQQLTYEAQLNSKIEIIEDCLRRVGKIKTLPPISIVPSPQAWQYRSRAGWQINIENQRLGYFEGGSHKICDVELCAVLDPELQRVLEILRGEMRAGTLQARGELEVVAGDAGISVAPPLGGFETAEVRRVVGAEEYAFNARSFFQINHRLLAPLIEEALRDEANTSATHDGTAVDLYCGVGLFTIPLARRFARVIGVESNSDAVRFAHHNLEHARLDNAQVVNSSVREWLWANEDLTGQMEFLLLDPPRTGAEPGAIGGIVRMKPKMISYVSCDPATLARDLQQLLSNGYVLETVKAFDLFPQTHHVETVTHLSAA